MRRRALLLVAAIVLLYLVLGLRGAPPVLMQAGGAAPRALASASAPAPERAARSAERSSPRAESPAAADEGPTIHVKRAHLIERVEIEPARPCRGQEVFVRVVPTPLGRRAKLFVQAKPTNPGVLRFAEPGPHPVRVLARDWYDKIDKRDVTVDVADCPAPPHTLALGAEQLAHGRVLLRASDASRSWQSYHWEFGDGSSATTQQPAIVHDYALRDQSAPTSTLLAKVTARAGAAAATANAAIAFVNADFIAAMSDAPTLPVRHERFARREGDLVTTQLEVRNLLHEDVELQSAELVAIPCRSAAEPREWSAAATDVLDDPRLPAGETATLALHLQLPADACRVQVWLHGSSSRGPLRVPFALELGVPDDAQRIRNPERLRELYRASLQLGRPWIEPADLERLRAEGRI